MAKTPKRKLFTKSAFSGSPGFRQRPGWVIIYFIGALLVVILFASIYGLTHNAGQGTTSPTGSPTVPATVSPATTISSTANGAAARDLVIKYYEGYVAQLTSFSSDTAARHAYLAKYMDNTTIGYVDAQNWYGYVPCSSGFLSESVLYEPATISGNKATINVQYDVHHTTTPQVVVDLNAMKIVSVKCVPQTKY
jgi:hypothetical protein